MKHYESIVVSLHLIYQASLNNYPSRNFELIYTISTISNNLLRIDIVQFPLRCYRSRIIKLRKYLTMIAIFGWFFPIILLFVV